MDLISRNAAIQSIDENIEAICEENDLTAYQEETASMCREWFVDEIVKVPSVPAVPLDKLCEWLARNAYAFDCKDCEEYCRAMIECENEVGCDPEYWKNKLTKWMEEQDAAD